MSRQIARGTARGPNLPHPLHAPKLGLPMSMNNMLMCSKAQATVIICFSEWPIQARVAPLVYHHAHQNKYKEEGSIHLPHECLHVMSITSACTWLARESDCHL